MPELKFAL